MIYVLSSSSQIFGVRVRVQESRKGDGAASASLALSLKQFLSAEMFDEQQQYLNNAAIASYVSFNKIDQRNRFKASVQLEPQLGSGDYAFIEGSSSSGLGFGLALFDAWWYDLNKGASLDVPVFATGEIGLNGEIKPISYYNEKIKATVELAKSQDIQGFYLCLPKANEADIDETVKQEAMEAGATFFFHHRMQALLADLYGAVYDGDPLGRWEAFKGLQSFNYEDSLRFFGRDKDVQRLFNDLQSNDGILIVSGQSGSGKSSLIKAGLIPYLEKQVEQLRWVTTTPKEISGSVLDHLLSHLVHDTALSVSDIKDSLLNGSISRDEIESLLTPNELFLFHIDQFEEFYTTDNGQNKDINLGVLQELTQKTKRIKIVLSIRNEYLPILLDSGAIKSPVISNVSGNLDFEAWQAIVLEQAAFSGYAFEQSGRSLAHEIIDDALNTPNSLPMVEFVLQQLSEQAKQTEQTNLLTHQAYNDMGRLVGAIAKRADEAVDIAHTDQKYVHHFFSLFVSKTNDGLAYAKRFAYLNNGEQLSTELNAMIKRAIDASILISASAKGNELKLAHDCLFSQWQAVKDWLSAQEEYLHWRNAVDHHLKIWIAHQQKPAYALKDRALLKQGKSFLAQEMIVEDDVITYILLSQQKNRSNAIMLSFFLLLLLMLPFFYFYDIYDQNRVKVEYHTAIGERWSVPYGLYEIDEETASHRTGTYKLEYQYGLLRTLSYVNGYGTLIPDETREENSLWKYHYKESGDLDHVDFFNHFQQPKVKHYFEFDSTKQRARVVFKENFSKKSNVKYSDIYRDGVANSSYIDGGVIQQLLLSYNENGFNDTTAFMNRMGDEVSYLNQYAIEKHSYHDNGLINSIYFLNSDETKTTNDQGIEEKVFYYDDFNQVNQVTNKYSQDKIINIYFNKDKYGNTVAIFLKNEDDLPHIVYEFTLDDHGLKKEIGYLFPHVPTNMQESTLSKDTFLYDTSGRITHASSFDQKGNSLPVRIQDILFIWPYVSEVYLDKDRVLDKKDISVFYNKDGLIEKLCHEEDTCSSAGAEYDRHNRLASISLAETKIPFRVNLDDNNINFISADRNRIVYDQDGNVSEFILEDSQKNINLTLKLKYDKKGNNIETTQWFGEKPAVSLMFPHKIKSLYDDSGRMIQQSLFDESGNPMNHLAGVSIHKKSYDKKGRIIEEIFLDKDNNSIMPTVEGVRTIAHKTKTIYSEKGNIKLREEYFDENNKQIVMLGLITDDDKKRIYIDPDVYSAEKEAEKSDVVYINSLPDGALVYQNNELIGMTPLKQKPNDNYDLKLSKKGYIDYVISNNSSSQTTKDYPLVVEMTKDKTSIYSNELFIEADAILSNQNGTNESIEKAINICLQLIEEGFVKPYLLLSKYYYKNNEFDKSKASLLKAVDLGDDEAQYELAKAFYREDHKFIPFNNSKNENMNQFYKFSSLSALQDNKDGFVALAYYHYELGENNKYLENHGKACNLGSYNSCDILASKFKENKDFYNALKYYQLAYNLGHPMALISISMLYHSSDFLYYIDMVKSLYYAHKSYLKNQENISIHNLSISVLGSIYNTIGNLENSFYWYNKGFQLYATEFSGLSSLGSNYNTNKAVSRNTALSLFYYTRAMKNKYSSEDVVNSYKDLLFIMK